MLKIVPLIAIALCAFCPVASARCPIGAIQGLSDRNCYKVYAELLSWDEADGRCEAEHGHLTPITSAQLNSFLTTLGTKLGCATSYWVGGVWNAEVASGWAWTDGSRWSYTNWAKGQPIKGPVCLTLDVTSGTWYSVSCTELRSYICRVPEVGAGGQTPPPNLPTPPPPDRCPVGWSYVKATGLCYQVLPVSTSYSWTSARTACQGLGGDLASIRDYSVNAAVLTFVLNAQPSDAFVTIGLSYNSTASKWTWVDGSNVGFTNWYTAYPLSPDSYTCAYMKVTAPGIGEWIDSECFSSSYAVICERESFEF